MNPVTFNEPFKRYFAAPDMRGSRDNSHLEPQLMVSPLFIYEYEGVPSDGPQDADTMSPEARRELIFHESGAGLLPFPMLRVAIQNPRPNGASGQDAYHYFAFNGVDRAGHACTWLLIDMRVRKINPELGMDAFVQTSFYLKVGNDVRAEADFFETKHFRSINYSLSQPKKYKLVEHMTALFYSFLFDVNSPANHVAQVVPDAPAKSVEWRKAREHYVILNRKHAANSATVKEGQTVGYDPLKNMERIAHSRRAHWRHFKSDRFKNVKGTRKRIASIWVGPEEWRDDSKSIYKLVR